MLYRARFLLLPISLLFVLASGCGSSATTPDAGPPTVDQCLNASDLAILASLVATPDGGVPDGGPIPTTYQSQLTAAVRTCALQSCLNAILSDDQAEQCMIDCLDTTAVAGLSTGCIACQNEAMRCAAGPCINLCLGSDTQLCLQCGFEHCGARTIECTGLPQAPP